MNSDVIRCAIYKYNLIFEFTNKNDIEGKE